MKLEERRRNIKKAVSAFSEEKCEGNQFLSELELLKQQVINCTFNSDYADNMSLSLVDVVSHLRTKSEELGGIEPQKLNSFEDHCYEIQKKIGRRKAGERGEKRVLEQLQILSSEYVVLNNIELHSEDLNGEIDIVVLSPKGIFLLEVKNSSRDMIIDKRGNYFRANGYMEFDYNIGDKVNDKVSLIRKYIERNTSIESKRIKINSFIVFANPKMKIENHYAYVKCAYGNQIGHIIEKCEAPDIYTLEEIEEINNVLINGDRKEKYSINDNFSFSIDEFKNEFADILALLEKAAGTIFDSDEAELKNKKHSFRPLLYSTAGMSGAYICYRGYKKYLKGNIQNLVRKMF